MKANKMTNEELARELIETVGLDGPFCQCDRCMTVLEASARLRRPTPVDDDLLKMAKDIDAKDAEIAKLRTLTTHTDNSEVIAELQRRLKEVEEFASEMKKSTNSLVRACGHQVILRLRGEGVNDGN